MFKVEEVNQTEWNKYFKLTYNNNILQTWQYGEAKISKSNWNAVRFSISNEKGQVVGLAQFIYRDFPLIGGVARMNRGPIFLIREGHVGHEFLFKLIINSLLQESKRRKWRIVLMAPEIVNFSDSKVELNKLGLHKLSKDGYASGKINLKVSEDSLMMSFKKKWRYYLRKSLSTEIDIKLKKADELDLNLLISKYKELQKKNSFTGLNESLIVALSKYKTGDCIFSLFQAEDSSSKDFLGLLVLLIHGDTATYFIGLTNEKGRQMNTNYALLWEAILYAKKIDCCWFDIGGLDNTTPEGITHFKKGLNSNLYSLIGEWGYFQFPFSIVKNLIIKFI